MFNIWEFEFLNHDIEQSLDLDSIYICICIFVYLYLFSQYYVM